MTQRQATLARSDQISRAANSEIQASLAERDEEIAGCAPMWRSTSAWWAPPVSARD